MWSTLIKDMQHFLDLRYLMEMLMWFDLECFALESYVEFILFLLFFHLVVLLNLFQRYFIQLIFRIKAEMSHLQPQHFVLMLLFELRLVVFNIIFTKMSVFSLFFDFYDFFVYRGCIFLLLDVFYFVGFLLGALLNKNVLSLLLFGFFLFRLISFLEVLNFV